MAFQGGCLTRMVVVYSIGVEISSSNYRPYYCDVCDADTSDQCRCISKCKECGQDHSYHPNLTGIQTSIEVIFAEQFNEPQLTNSHGVQSNNKEGEGIDR